MTGAHVMDDALRRHREAIFLGAVVDLGQDLLAQLQHRLDRASLPSSRSASAVTVAPISPITSASGW
jgi:hypothetical protein